MKKSEKPASKETSLDDSIQLAIRDEVEKRVEQRDALYWKIGSLFVALVVLFFAVLWRVSVSEIRETVEKQLAEKEVVKARDRIMAINSAAEDMNHNLIAISSSMNTNQQHFMERLGQIKKQDNLVLMDDFSSFFVLQSVTNLINGQKIVMDYDAIPQTVRIVIGTPANWSIIYVNGFYMEGNNIVVTNNAYLNTINSIITNSQYPLSVEYVRKSLR